MDDSKTYIVIVSYPRSKEVDALSVVIDHGICSIAGVPFTRSCAGLSGRRLGSLKKSRGVIPVREIEFFCTKQESARISKKMRELLLRFQSIRVRVVAPKSKP